MEPGFSEFSDNEKFDYENWLDDVSNKGVRGETCTICDRLLTEHSLEDDVDCNLLLQQSRRYV